jgi:hypothetical protein
MNEDLYLFSRSSVSNPNPEGKINFKKRKSEEKKNVML